MPSENPLNKYPVKGEVLKPKEQLFIASANVIDQQGKQVVIEGSSMEVYDALWNDDSLEHRFKLQRQEFPDPWNPTTYFLTVYDYSSHEHMEHYRYNLKDHQIYTGTKSMDKVKRKDSDVVVSSLLEYLSSVTKLTDEEEQIFLEIMTQDGAPDMRPKRRIRRFASEILKGMGHGVRY